MKIFLAHFSKFVNTKTSWIYFGNSYLKMKYCEDKLTGERIILNRETHDQAKIQKKTFLEWIESQRIINKDSLNWWMTQIAGRNNAHSSFYLSVCQFFAIKEYLKSNNKEKEILIICEDFFLLKLLHENLYSEFKIKKSLFLKFYFFKDFFNLLFTGFLSQIKLVIFFIVSYFCARITKPKKLIKPTGDIILFHHALDSVDAFKDGDITCKYFTILPNWLKKKGEKVFALPWLGKNRTSINFYKKLRNTQNFVPEDWLNFSDYLNSFKNSLKSLRTLNYEIKYPGIKLDQLIFREKLYQTGEQSAIFWRYIPAIKKWSQEIKSITVYDHYENMMFEHSIRYIIKKLPIKSTTIGFYHSLISKEYMAYHHLVNEWKSQVKPDFIVCPGEFSKKILLEQGVPEKKIIAAASLRQPFSENKVEVLKKNNTKRVLILLSLFTEANIESLLKIYSNNSLITNDLNLEVRVKPHPMMNKEALLRKIKWNELPKGWQWTKNDLYKELQDSYCTISMSTGSIFDAVLNDNIVVSIMSDLNLMDNYLDVFTDKYSLSKASSEKDLPTKLKDIFIFKTKEYREEFNSMKNELIQGTNLINEKNLKAFILGKN